MVEASVSLVYFITFTITTIEAAGQSNIYTFATLGISLTRMR
jgi:hypothetical protein